MKSKVILIFIIMMALCILPLMGLVFHGYLLPRVDLPGKDLAGKFSSPIVKSAAKTYLKMMNFDEEKRKTVEKLQGMSDEEFKKEYSSAYKSLREISPFMKDVYGIDENMTRLEAIQKIEGMNKEKISGIIDDTPYTAIIDLLKKYLDFSKEKKKPPVKNE